MRPLHNPLWRQPFRARRALPVSVAESDGPAPHAFGDAESLIDRSEIALRRATPTESARARTNRGNGTEPGNPVSARRHRP